MKVKAKKSSIKNLTVHPDHEQILQLVYSFRLIIPSTMADIHMVNLKIYPQFTVIESVQKYDH